MAHASGPIPRNVRSRGARLRAIGMVALFLLAAWEPDVVLGRDGWQAVRVPIPAFSLDGLGGAKLRPADLAGKVAVADFWATWCAPCVAELPELQAFHKRLAGRRDVVFLSFSVSEPPEAIAHFAKVRGITFPVYFADVLEDPLAVESYPTKLILDFRDPKRPLVRFRREGTATADELAKKLDEVLAERRP